VSYVLAFLGFAALIILHEAGHFTAAKAVGMRVERFSLFFGPMIFKRTIGETEYGVGIIPLGGYVKITGMTPEEVFETPSVEARAYTNQPVWKRIVVIFAGPLVNLVIAFAILWAVVLSNGVYVNGHKFEISATQRGSVASTALKPGDQLVSVNGATTETGMLKAISSTRCPGAQTNGCVADPAVAITVKRHGKLMTFDLHGRYSSADKRALVGFDFGIPQVNKSVGAASAVGYSVRAMGSEIGHTFSALGRIFQAKERRQLHSVVGIYDATQQAVSTDPSEAWTILALVSLALGVFNLLPFLPLDGGHIFWALAEKVRGKKISLVTMERASFIGIALMLALVAIGFTNDINTITSGGSFLR
jgi:regulator of sigma E protease